MKNLLMIHLIIISVLTACASSEPATATHAPTTTQTPTAILTLTPTMLPTSTVTPAPTVFAPGIPEFPDPGSGEPAGPEEPAGAYKPPAGFSIPFTFETSKVYRGIYEKFSNAQIFGISQGRDYRPLQMLLFWVVEPSYSVDQVLSDLRATKNMTSTENQEVEIAGVPATQFDGISDGFLYIPALGKFVGHKGDDWSTDDPKDHLRFIVLSVSGRTLLVYIEAPQAEWDSFIADANQVLDTIEFAATTP